MEFALYKKLVSVGLAELAKNDPEWNFARLKRQMNLKHIFFSEYLN